MRIRNATEAQVLAAAEAAKVGIREIETRGVRVPEVKVTLAPLGGDIYRRTGFRPTSTGKYQRINAVCFHGHLAFFRALYALAPAAQVFTTTMLGGRPVTYVSAAHLEEVAPDVGSLEVMRGLPMKLACVCHDWNVGGVLPDWAKIAVEEPDEYARALAL